MKTSVEPGADNRQPVVASFTDSPPNPAAAATQQHELKLNCGFEFEFQSESQETPYWKETCNCKAYSVTVDSFTPSMNQIQK